MTRSTVVHVAAIAALLVSTAASAASYTGHYKNLRDPSQDSYDRLQSDLATCDGIYGVQHATPSKSYQSCMRKQGWKFLYETRDKDTASDGFNANVKLKPGHYIDHDSGMDCQNFGGAAVCGPPDGTVHYYDPDQGLPCTRTGIVSICSNM
jgi:hypothetical protein